MKRVGFAANTLVHAQSGVVPIQSVQAGDFVLSQDDGGSERVLRRVVKVHQFPDRSFVCIDFWKTVEGWENGERGGLVASEWQPVWVQGHGWKEAGNHWGRELLERHDGGTCEWINGSPVYRTDVEGLAWLDGMVNSTRGSGLGRIIDLRDGKIRFHYEMVPNGDCDPAESQWTLKQSSYALEVEGRGAYFAGEWGIRVRSAAE